MNSPKVRAAIRQVLTELKAMPDEEKRKLIMDHQPGEDANILMRAMFGHEMEEDMQAIDHKWFDAAAMSLDDDKILVGFTKKVMDLATPLVVSFRGQRYAYCCKRPVPQTLAGKFVAVHQYHRTEQGDAVTKLVDEIFS